MYRKVFKRAFDLLFSLIFIVTLLPVFLIISLIILLRMGHPVLFVQKRPGRNGRIFNIYKFRSMTKVKPDERTIYPDIQRITKLGSFLRRSSLDELPELFNVFIGDMSFVGPRPLLIEYLPLYNKDQARRHEVLPGITGWAQINGRNTITWEDKFRLDVYYVDHISLKLDVKILMLTVIKVLKSEGINSTKDETMSMFTGSKKTFKTDISE